MRTRIQAAVTPSRLFVLGRPEIAGPDDRPHVPFGKPLALLAYLAAEGRPVPRTDLADLLWPDSVDRRARQSVREALSRIRRALGDHVFLHDDPVELAPSALRVDLESFESALRSGTLEEASVLWRGPFLEGLEIPDAPLWTRWKEEVRTRLERRFAEALVGGGRAAVEAGDPSGSLRWFRRAAEVQPGSVEVHRRLLETLLTVRRFDAWQEAWAEAVQALEPVGGLAGLKPLRRKFRRAHADIDGGVGEGSGPTVPFAGRARELGELLQEWRDVLAGRSRTVVLTGPTGVGKTRLARELADRVRARGTVVEVKPGEDGRGDLLGLLRSLVEALRGLPGSPGTSPASDRRLQRALDAGRRLGDRGGAVQDARELAAALEDLVGAVTWESPLLLVLDDVQRADPATLDVLGHFLVRRFDFPCLFLVLGRGEEGLGPADPVVSAWCGHEGVQCVPLRPLDREAVEQILGTFLRVPEGEGAVAVPERIYELTRGNALFLVELMEALSQAGALRFTDGRWTLVRTDLTTVLSGSPTVGALIHTRLQRLAPDARDVAARLAREGGPTRVSRLQRLSGMDAGGFVRAVAVLAERRILRWVDDERVDLAHDRFREVARQLPVRPSGVVGRRGRAAAAAAMLIGVGTVGWFGLAGGGAPPAPAPYGGGTLLVSLGDSVVELRPEGRGGPWSVTRPTLPVPPFLPKHHMAFQLKGGEVVWTGTGRDMEHAPFPVRLHLDGRVDTIFRTPLDESLPYLSPDGSTLVFSSENAATGAYDHHVVRSGPNGEDPTVIYTARTHATVQGWSLDGRRILVTVKARPDTVLLLQRDGQREAAFPVPGLSAVDWCGSDRIAMVADAGGEAGLFMLDAVTGDVRRVGAENLLRSRITCSPDGSAVVLRQAVDRMARRVVLDLENGRSQILPLGERPALIRWVPGQQPSRPTGLLVSGFRADLRWGERVKPEAFLERPEGPPEPTSVTWSSSDPSVAAVSPQGILYANRPGSTRIVARYRDLFADTTEITVSGSPVQEILLSEDFDRLDEGRWINGGHPKADVVRLGGAPALRINGDGRWTDGLILREGLELPRGATLEMEFHLRPEGRVDRQKVRVCLQQGQPNPDGNPEDPVDWMWSERACVGYPAEEGPRYDPAEIRFIPYVGSRTLPDLLPSDDWVHLGVQLRADGEVTFIVDRAPVATSPVLRGNDPGDRWRIFVAGASVDTELLVRNMVLWEGPRY